MLMFFCYIITYGGEIVLKKRKILSGTLATLVFVGGISATITNVSAAEINSSKQVTYQTVQNQLTENQLASDIEFIFEKAASLKDGKYILNKQLIAGKFGQENVASIVAFIKLVNGEELSEADLIGVPKPEQFSITGSVKNDMIMIQSASSWSKCVGDKIIDATGIGFISGGLWKLIERKNWTKVATELAKIVGKNAIKGGVIGFAASLAWYGIKCK
jgi:hypothetical protein